MGDSSKKAESQGQFKHAKYTTSLSLTREHNVFELKEETIFKHQCNYASIV